MPRNRVWHIVCQVKKVSLQFYRSVTPIVYQCHFWCESHQRRGESVLGYGGEFLPHFVSLRSAWEMQEMDGLLGWTKWENNNSAALWIRCSLFGTTSKAEMWKNRSTG
jgi:hypothetical protein